MKKNRCGWCLGDQLYETYHDLQWGVPVHDEQELFEMLILETFQAGLSWITVLKKRENFREAFDFFDYQKIANYTEDKITQLLNNPGIIRNKLKVHATINNASRFMEIQKEFGSFNTYLWNFVDHTPVQNSWKHYKDAPATTPLSDQISKDLKKRGFKFTGSTVIYAFMQAIGMVNDHEVSCFRYEEVKG
ncbi:DNA-3-methyladenine glycosylase I [Aquimarina sp. ERC-38]|uniref:DNA-3-methyladenine glycosylase I n=1 Tax=Aquimarina sp. ERC-38 TaxID=2949996 RepID=UPI002246130C|nr:DNA-3-methyladenine glycosylase I [Aquimarina sp. ERC-38]UZO81616.1 DNA-3-methyladenine glycosylase I [Aquimarina sp. ERC-38]